MDIRVVDNPASSRFEITVDGAPAGFAAYRADPDRIVFTHTEIDPSYEGHGLGGTLVAAALDDAQRRGLTVEPRCPFVAEYLRQHQERYASLTTV